jgi:hypothetical protein
MFEHRTRPLLSKTQFLRRVFRHFLIGGGIVASALGMGVLGYHLTEGLSWVDSLLNASMILGGMGPVNPVTSVSGKLFASFYALFSGLLFVGLMGVMLGPFVHRLIHSVHLEYEGRERAEE